MSNRSNFVVFRYLLLFLLFQKIVYKTPNDPKDLSKTFKKLFLRKIKNIYETWMVITWQAFLYLFFFLSRWSFFFLIETFILSLVVKLYSFDGYVFLILSWFVQQSVLIKMSLTRRLISKMFSLVIQLLQTRGDNTEHTILYIRI